MGGATHTGERSPRDTTEELTNEQHLNADAEEYNEDETCHEDEAELDGAAVTEAVLEPGRNEDATVKC